MKMVLKADAETAIRHLAIEWASETGYVRRPGHYPSFSAFRSWLEEKHFSLYLRFRSTGRPSEDVAQDWFEAQLREWHRTAP